MIGPSVGWIRSFRRSEADYRTVTSQLFAYKRRSVPFLPPSPPTTTSDPRSDAPPPSLSTPDDATMLNIANRTATAWRSVQRAAAGMATAARIGDTKVPMSLLEPGWYINYQRIEDNLAVVRDRCTRSLTFLSHSFCSHVSFLTQVTAPSHLVREGPLWSLG